VWDTNVSSRRAADDLLEGLEEWAGWSERLPGTWSGRCSGRRGAATRSGPPSVPTSRSTRLRHIV